MRDKIIAEIKDSIAVKQTVIEKLIPSIEQAAKAMLQSLQAGNKIMFFGNGGSAADAQHLAGELIGRFLKERKALPAIALTTDSSILTCLGNDYSFDIIFARQIEGLAKPGDIAFGISTSGNSKNILLGLEKAKATGCKTIGLLGCGGGKIAGSVDIAIAVPSKATPRVQESHIMIGHILCNLIEEGLFPQ
jgi:D-sedoheptulose 7-phosphate isomerase